MMVFKRRKQPTTSVKSFAFNIYKTDCIVLKLWIFTKKVYSQLYVYIYIYNWSSHRARQIQKHLVTGSCTLWP